MVLGSADTMETRSWSQRLLERGMSKQAMGISLSLTAQGGSRFHRARVLSVERMKVVSSVKAKYAV